jgi:hypothetical protein
MTAPSALDGWRPNGFDALISLETPPVLPASADGDQRRDGSSADLRARQRDLAFDMYAEALMRIADEDDAAYARDRRATA